MPQLIAALIRHGSYEQPVGVPSAHLPYGLNRVGREHALAGALEVASFARSAGLGIDAVLDSSPLRRAWETAEIIAQSLAETLGRALAVAPFDELCERSVGAMANLSVADIEKITAEDPRLAPLPEGWKRDPHHVLPYVGAESLLDAGARVARHIEARTAQPPHAPTLKVFVGHGGAFRHAAFHLGLLQEQDLAALSMHHGRPVFIARRGATWVQVGGEWKQRHSAEGTD